ncbi:MAG: extensin family protein, partial [Polyangiaceae bacterium]
VRYLYKTTGEIYDVNSNDDFAQFTSGDTCGAGIAAQTGVSLELYSLACEASAREIFGTILTPNHNDAHRNHFHMDIGQSGTPTSFFVE